MTSFRVDGHGRVDRANSLRFTFDGKAYSGLQGDTLASALLANGVHFVGRSFKYHRPRGILSASSEEPNALVRIDRGVGRREPNTRATMQELFSGLSTESQNRWPSLQFDIGATLDAAHGLIPTGFYYKTFMWPRFYSGAMSTSQSFGEYRDLDVSRPRATPIATRRALPIATC